MNTRLPVWIIGPSLILVSLASIWAVGEAQLMGSSHEPKITASAEPIEPNPSGAAPAPAATPDSRPFPDFSGTTADGKTFKLSAVKGKVVLINIWATWCGPCRMEIPDLIALQKKYGPRGFVVVGLSEDDDFARAAAFANQNHITYPIIKTPDSINQAVAVEGLPTSFLLNRDGLVVKAMDGISSEISPEQMWASEIEKLL